MEIVLSNGFMELSAQDLMDFDGGEWSWKAFGQSVVGGAVGGAAGGAVTGAMAGGVGAAPGAGIGAIGGAVGGAVTYLVCGWW